tara:strand:+ start:308 stop:1708 length:1401 start_codon:yes stop_codon:yes gene_type:complete
MADFQFEVEISAKIQELERALNKATTATQQAAAKMSAAIEAEVDPAFAGLTDTMADLGEVVRKEEAEFENLMSSLDRVDDDLDRVSETVSNNLEPSFGKMLQTISKVGAALFLAEGAFKIGTAALRGLSGDADAARQALQSIPVVGPLITSFLEFGDALISLASSASEASVKMLELELASKRAEAAASSLAGRVQAESEQLKLLGADDARIQEQLISDRIRLLEMAHKKRLEQIHDQRVAESELIMSRNLSIDDEERLLREVRDNRMAAIKAADEELQIRKQNLQISLDIAKAQRESRVEATEVQEEQDEKARREAFRQEMEDMAIRQAEQMSGIIKAEELRKKKQAEIEEFRKKKQAEIEELRKKKQAEIDAKRDEQMKREQAFLERRKEVEEEIAEAREKAEQAVMSSTASFSTAGGSFTTAATAQVNEAKLLRSISQQSRDFLQQIVNNTAAFAGGGTGLGFA